MSKQPDSDNSEKSNKNNAEENDGQEEMKSEPAQTLEEVAKEETTSQPVQTLEKIAKDITIQEQKERGQFSAIIVTLSLIFGLFSLPFVIFKPALFDWLPYSLEIISLTSILFLISAVIVNKK